MHSVLIVGAGPTGLALAITLAQLQIPVRIIDQAKGPGETSRAIAVQARTLELYHQLGIVDEILTGGIKVEELEIYQKSKLKGKASLHNIGKKVTPYPFVLSLPQDDHEKILKNILESYQIKVEYDTSFITCETSPTKIKAIIKKSGVEETHHYSYICGCDGAHSTVRHIMNIDFPGGTYPHIFYVADVIPTRDINQHSLQMCLDDDEFCLVIPVRSSGSVRLIGIIPRDKEQQTNFTFGDIADSVKKNMNVIAKQVNWFSSYRVHYRVAQSFHKDRFFILGDAAHIHSPAGGQGMNTGIGDAVNLGWKLAAVLKNQASDNLLNTYEKERLPFAKQLVASTDKIFNFMTATNWLGKIMRNYFVPYVMPRLLSSPLTRGQFFKLVSQIRIAYPQSELSLPSSKTLPSGVRLPWFHHETMDNYAKLNYHWRVQIYGKISHELKNFCETTKLNFEVFDWLDAMKKFGFRKDTAYLIRPDGYISTSGDVTEIKKLLSHFNLNFS